MLIEDWESAKLRGVGLARWVGVAVFSLGLWTTPGVAALAYRKPAAYPIDGVSRSAPWVLAGVGDVSGDGVPDLIWHDPSSTGPFAGDIVVDRVEAGAVTVSSTVGNVQGWTIAGIGDFTGDGKVDLFWRRCSNGRALVWKLDGTTASNLGLIGTYPCDEVATMVGDFDGNGKDDLFLRYLPGTANPSEGENRLWLASFEDGVLSGVEVPYNILSISGWSPDAIGDFDGNGLADVAWRSESSGEIVAYLTEICAATGLPRLGAGSGYFVTPDGSRVHPSASVYPIVGVGQIGPGGTDDLLFRGNSGVNYAMWVYEVDGKSVTHARSLPFTKFRDPEFELRGTGDFDGDGYDDLVWHDDQAGEVWIAPSTPQIRGVHFSPNTPVGDFWPRFMLPTDSPPVTEAIRSELQAIRDKTGLTEVQVNFGAGFNVSYPTPTGTELERLRVFFEVAHEAGMRVVLNLGTNCWVADSKLYPDDPSAVFRHVGGQSEGSCFSGATSVNCVDVAGTCCSLTGSGCEVIKGCSRLHWSMPTCSGSLPEVVDWYDQVLDFLQSHAEGFAETLAYVNISGDPLDQFPGEPAVFDQAFFGAYGDDVEDFLAEVVPSLDDHGVRVGIKSWLSPTPDYPRLDNLASAVSAVHSSIDYFDLTANIRVNPAEVLDRLDLDPATEATRLILSDFKAAQPPWTDLEPALHPLEELFACFFGSIKSHDLGGWWFWQYRDEGHRVGIRENAGGPGPDPAGVSTWKEPSVNAILRQEGLVGIAGLPAMPPCTIPIPYLP